MNADPSQYLSPTPTVDSDHPSVVAFAATHAAVEAAPPEQASDVEILGEGVEAAPQIVALLDEMRLLA